MPLQLENLDDRTYKDLVEEALSMIPNYAPNWTNHNPSDPGITLIEMFAYLTEILIYRLNRVTDDNVHAFLKLLNGPGWNPSEQKTLTEEVRETVMAIRQTNRAITCKDFEDHALAADDRVARAHCVSRRNLESENSDAYKINRDGHISVVIVPDPQKYKKGEAKPGEDIIKIVKNYLEPRRLLTTVVHVVPPRYFSIGVCITLHLKRDALENVTLDQALDSLSNFFHHINGGHDGKGWPFGRNVFVSEIYELLDTLPGVDFVEKTIDPETNKPLDEITIDEIDGTRRIPKSSEDMIGVEIQPDELVAIQIDKDDITIVTPNRIEKPET